MKQEGRDNSGGRRVDIVNFLIIVFAAVILTIAGSLVSVRADLTSDRRHTLSVQTKKILRSINNDVFIQVYLDGEMPLEFKRLRRSVKAMLDEFRIISGRRVDYIFINPSTAKSESERENFYTDLVNRGLNPVNIMDQDEEGGYTEKMIFPGMIVNYNGVEMPVNFLRNNPSSSAEQNLANSIEGLEYELIRSVSTISSDTIYRVAFLEGHGELDELEVADLTLEMAKYFTIDRGAISGMHGVLDSYAAIIIAKPERPFSEEDKLVIDQFIMSGGRVLWLVDGVYVNSDSLAMGGSMALYEPLNIEDQLFKYGARINPVIVQDMDCIMIPVRADRNDQQQYIPAPWIYYPLLYPSAQDPVTRNLNKVKGEFVSTIDTVGEDSHIKKSFLVASSPYSRIISPPRIISLDEYRNPPPEEAFTESFMPVAIKMEGEFKSLYANRVKVYNGTSLRTESISTRMIVIADGDIIRNEVTYSGTNVNPLPLGYDRYSRQTFGNKDFLINCMNWLVDDTGIIELRSREVKIRLLDPRRIRDERLFWQLLNTAGPLVLVIIAAFVTAILRRRKYGLS